MESLELAEKHLYHDRLIDFMRGVAALTVFASHSDQSALLKFQFVTDHKIFMGRYGVYLFFVLSGYLIWRSAQRTLTLPRGLAVYAVHRVTRIVPLYFVHLLFVIFVLGALGSAFQPDITQETVLRHLIFSQSLVPSVSRDLNPVLWTLTHEAIYYALVPVLLMLRVRGWRIVALAALFLLLNYAGMRTFITPFLVLFYLFVFGILVAERQTETVIAGTVALLALVFWAPPAGPTEFAAALSAAATFLLIWPACRACARFPRLLWALWPVCWAGVISYSLCILALPDRQYRRHGKELARDVCRVRRRVD